MVKIDRGQLLLVAGVLIAVVILAAAVLLNGVLAPETSTTRGLAADVDAIEREAGPLRADLERLFEHTTSVDDYGAALPYADRADLAENLTAFDGLVVNGTARERGAVLRVAYNDSRSVSGPVLVQWPTGPRAYRNNSNDADWELASGVAAVPRATFVMTDRPGPGDGAIVVSGGGQTWTLNASATALRVEGPAVTDRDVCAGVDPGDEIVVEVRNAPRRNATAAVRTADGREECGSFAFGGEVPTPWEIEVADGNRIRGRYVIGVVGTASPGAGPLDWPELAGTDLVSNPGVDVTYVADGVTYESTYGIYNRTEP